jgi:hypothetical protein
VRQASEISAYVGDEHYPPCSAGKAVLAHPKSDDQSAGLPIMAQGTRKLL